MQVFPIMRMVDGRGEDERRVGLISLVHVNGHLILDVTDRGVLDSSEPLEDWRIEDLSASVVLRSCGGGGGGSSSGDPLRRFHRSHWVFEAPSVPHLVRITEECSDIDEVVAMSAATTVVPPTIRVVPPARLSIAERDRVANSGAEVDPLPTSIAATATETGSVAIAGALLRPTMVETWRDATTIVFRVLDAPPDFMRSMMRTPWSDGGVVAVDADGIEHRGLWSGRGGRDGRWLSLTYAVQVRSDS